MYVLLTRFGVRACDCANFRVCLFLCMCFVFSGGFGCVRCFVCVFLRYAFVCG